MRQSSDPVIKTLTLMRGQMPVTSLLGAFGGALRETRITAMLGYLISHDPSSWEDFFTLADQITSVEIEADHENDRSDILIETPNERVIIEAKVEWVDPKIQANKYDADRKYFLTNYVPDSEHNSRKLQYISWPQLGKQLDFVSKHASKPYVRHLSKELVLYMKEHQLIRGTDSVEIYARDLNDDITVETFLRCNIYGCWLEKDGGTISRASYFAPCFGQHVAHQHSGISSGISYVAKIESLEVVDTWKSFLFAAKRQRGAAWINKHQEILGTLRRSWKIWDKENRRNIAFLGTPRLVFNPAINKDLLQKGKGFLSRRTFSFDELFEAWSKSSSARMR
jgi:hypothetical protein